MSDEADTTDTPEDPGPVVTDPAGAGEMTELTTPA
jgi:hypothetical protein